MPKYRTKPVEIEAFQMTAETRHIPLGWPDWLQKAFKLRPIRAGSMHVLGGELVVETPQGPMPVAANDWIVRAGTGEIYPCGPETFTDYYEAVQ